MIVRFRQLFPRIRLERELQGHRAAAAFGGEEGMFLVICNALLKLAIKKFFARALNKEGEGIDLDKYYGKDK